MFNLAFKVLLSRKKWLLLLVISFALIISSIVAIYSSTKSIRNNLLTQSFKQYGEFSGAILNVTDNNKIKKSSNKFGEYKLFNSYKIKENIVMNIGWADNSYFDVGHISLKSGNLPVATGEVAIESFYLDAIDPTWKLNQSRIIKIGEKKLQLKLVGIVENYSSKWTIRNNHYPNMFLFNSDLSTNVKTNYLIPFKKNYSIAKNIKFVQSLPGNNEDSVINDNLLYTGLKDYGSISVLSISLQIIILIVSSLCIVTMLSFFNANQGAKFAIFKALGCSNNYLYMISILQTTFIYFLGILASIPLIMVLHYSIIKNTYGFTIINKDSIVEILIGIVIWLFILYVLLTVISFWTVRKSKHSSISKEIQAKGFLKDTYSEILNNFKSFSLKQLSIQLLSHRTTSILSILTLSFSILLILLSVTLAKESKGIWNAKFDYYLNSQQVIGTKVIDGQEVIINKGFAFLPDEVREIESLKGVEYIDKTPFMLDVKPIISTDFLTSSLISWIHEYSLGSEETFSDNGAIIPNVKYVLMPSDKFSELTSINNKEELKKSAVIHIPGAESDEKEQLQGEELGLSKASLSREKLSVEKWDFRIVKIIDTPYKVDYDVTKNVNNEITIILDEKAAVDYGITQGYKELVVYTGDDLSKEESSMIYDKIYALTVGVPGSMFQYIPDLIFDRTRLSDFLDFLGSFSFYISVGLSILTISLVIYGKYRMQRRYWGIYRSLGLSKNKLFNNLILELSVYYVAAIIVSCAVYSCFLFLLDGLDYSLVSYLIFYISTIFTVLLMLVASAIIIREVISRDSISKLLKIEE